MTTVEFLSPLDTPGIEVIPVRRRPHKAMVGRKPFPILDLRTSSEAAYEATKQAQPFEKHIRFLSEQYAHDAPLQEEPLLRCGPAAVFRGSVWFQGQPVQGSVHRKHNDDIGVWRDKVITFSDSPKTPKFDGVSAVIQAPGARNYFHWMLEVSPRMLSLRDYVANGGRLDRILLFYDNPHPFITQVLETFYPDLLPLIEYCTRPLCALDECLFFTAEKMISRWKTSTALFSEEIDARLSELPRGPGRAILVSRADAPTRRLVNEDLLLELFADRGLERVEFGALTVEGQMHMMADATLVIGVHGAGLTNLMFCRPGTAVIEVTSSQYIRRCRSFCDIAMYRDLNYGLAVVDQHGEQYEIVQNRGNDLELAASQVARLVTWANTLAPPKVAPKRAKTASARSR